MWGKQFGQEPLVNANTAAVLELCLDSFFLVEPCHICRSIPQPQKVATSESFIDLRCCLHTSAVLEPSLTYIFCHEWSLSQGIPLPYPATGGYLATAVLLFGLFQSQRCHRVTKLLRISTYSRCVWDSVCTAYWCIGLISRAKIQAP